MCRLIVVVCAHGRTGEVIMSGLEDKIKGGGVYGLGKNGT